ncbi:hypothetical protein SCLCIDRAFT_197959 [Scleroderma citrinum Foug A]|uniref:Uncharacterized protein n=1 Tax=Scleroderma citrinum Foug A TaxID=1036808 RepID=A0A0C3DKQ7_9AGAM|nr:hypothetical protein SCLCIDRAFT_197959 [Scleroderma citrinum Foug A]
MNGRSVRRTWSSYQNTGWTHAILISCVEAILVASQKQVGNKLYLSRWTYRVIATDVVAWFQRLNGTEQHHDAAARLAQVVCVRRRVNGEFSFT